MVSPDATYTDILNGCTQRAHTRSPWVGSIKNGAIEIRDRHDRPVVIIEPGEAASLGPREIALANLIVASPDLADFAQEFLELCAGDITSALVRMQEQPERLAQLQLLASLGVARMHGTAGISS